MKCYNHPESEGVGACTVCGKAICSDCAMEIDGKLVCKSCTQKMASQTISSQPGGSVNKKEPFLALFLSFLWDGLGQMYNGQVKKGFTIIVAEILLWFVIVILMFVLIGFCMLPIPVIMRFYFMYDAYKTAENINKGVVVKDWFE